MTWTSRVSTSRSLIAVPQLRVPVHQPFVTVDEALVEQFAKTFTTARVKCGSIVNCSRLQSIEHPSGAAGR